MIEWVGLCYTKTLFVQIFFIKRLACQDEYRSNNLNFSKLWIYVLLTAVKLCSKAKKNLKNFQFFIIQLIYIKKKKSLLFTLVAPFKNISPIYTCCTLSLGELCGTHHFYIRLYAFSIHFGWLSTHHPFPS